MNDTALRTVLREVARRLRAAREAGGLSLTGAAEKSGLTPAAIGSYERLNRPVSVANLVRLAAAYGVPPRSLLPVAGDPALELAAACDLAGAELTRAARRIRNGEGHDADAARLRAALHRIAAGPGDDEPNDEAAQRLADLAQAALDITGGAP